VSKEEKIIKNKVGMLKLAEMLGSVSQACKVREPAFDQADPARRVRSPPTPKLALLERVGDPRRGSLRRPR